MLSKLDNSRRLYSRSVYDVTTYPITPKTVDLNKGGFSRAPLLTHLTLEPTFQLYLGWPGIVSLCVFRTFKVLKNLEFSTFGPRELLQHCLDNLFEWILFLWRLLLKSQNSPPFLLQLSSILKDFFWPHHCAGLLSLVAAWFRKPYDHITVRFHISISGFIVFITFLSLSFSPFLWLPLHIPPHSGSWKEKILEDNFNAGKCLV